MFSIFNSVKTVETPLFIEMVKSKWAVKKLDTTIRILSSDNQESFNALEIAYDLSINYPFRTSSELVWTDTYYISDRSKFDEQYAIKLGESAQKVVATSPNTYQVSAKRQFNLENSVFGNYYVYVFVDENELVDKVTEYSSPIEKSIQIDKLLPILNITEFQVMLDAQSASNGYTVSVTWKVINIGKVRVDNPQFSFFAKPSSGSSMQLVNYQYDGTMYPKETKQLSTLLDLDLKFSGKISLIIKSFNTLESFFTIDKDSVDSTSVTIQQPPSADLAVKEVTFAATLENQMTDVQCNNNRFLVNLTYTVQNIAYSMDKLQTWTDRIAVICGNSVTLASKTLSVTKQLWSSDSYTNTHQFLVTLTDGYYGNCKVNVHTNVDNGVLELFSLDNNVKEKCCFAIPKKPQANFMTRLFEDLALNENWTAGEAYDLKYTIKNEGNGSRYSISSWRDSVYLHRSQNDSLGNILANGIVVGEKSFIDFELFCGASSSSNYTIRLQVPISLSGNYFLYFIHNPQGDGTVVVSNFNVSITPIEPCDVASTNGTLSSANNFTGGDTLSFSFEVYNIAKGRARGGWYDSVYLSKFPTVTSKDIRLITMPRRKELSLNEFYKMEFELKLPLSLASGTYFIVFVTDTAQVLPDLDRDNNQASIRINVDAISDADIFITNVTMAQTLDKGLNFTWKLSADRDLRARKCDSIYLSLDETFSFSDYELINGLFCEAFEIKLLPLNQLSSVNYAKKVQSIPLLPDGSYYGIVRTITNVQETNFDNNAGVSDKSMAIEVEELEINVVKEVTIKPNENNLFKFKPSVNMNTLRVELKTGSKTAYNDFFVNLKKLPTENTFTAKSRFANSFNQSAIIRNVKPDKYYLIVKSYLATSDEEYKVTVLIKDVQEIDIDLMEPTKLSKLGRNTVKLTGNFVPQKLEVCLMDGNTKAICAVKVYKVNVEVIYVTFDLTNASLNAGETYQLSVNNKTFSGQNIEIISGVMGSMQIKLAISQSVYRPNETAYADVVIKNNGDTDINVPVVLVSTVELFQVETPLIAANSLRFRSDKRADEMKVKPDYVITSINNQAYPPYSYDYLIAVNTLNLGGVIQPRSSMTLRLKVRPTSTAFEGRAKITVSPYENNFLLEYLKSNIDSFKSTIYTASTWKHLSQLLTTKAQENTQEILHETVNELTTNGVEFYRLSDLVTYHLNRLDGAFFTTNLIDSLEFYIFDTELAYTRSYAPRLSSRSTKHVPTGLGWTDNLHLKLEKTSVYDSLVLTYKGNQYSVDFRLSNTSYFSDVCQIDLKGNLATITLTENNLVYEYDMSESCILSISTVNENKFVNVNCRKGRIFEVYNSELSIQFAYTSNSLLRTITRSTLDAPKETYSFVYDDFDRLIEFTSPFTSAKYEYDNRSNLIQSATSDGVMLKFEYNSDNMLSRFTRYENSGLVFDYGYKYFDYGSVEVTDGTTERKVRFFYDLNGRVLYYEENEIKRVNYVTSADLSETNLLVNGDVVKKIRYDEKLNSVDQIFDDEVFSKRILFEDETNESIEYSDRLKNKIQLTRQLVNNTLQIEELVLPNGLKETKTYDLLKNELHIRTRNDDDLTIKYDDNSNRVFYSHATGDTKCPCSFEYTSQRSLSAARGQDAYASVVNSFDSSSRLVKTRMKNDFEIDYTYDDKSNLVEMRTSENMAFKYTRDQNARITAVSVNGEVMVTLNYSQNSYRLTLPEISRFFEYSYSSTTGQLMSYTVGDLKTAGNSVRYEYEYNHKLLMKTMKLVTNQDDSYVSQYSYDNSDRLVSVRNDKLNATFDVVYDSNGNRRSFHSRVGNQSDEQNYAVNQLNQYTTDGSSVYIYDLNGNIISETDESKSSLNSFNYYEDGKLSQFISKNDNCSVKYDCLERVSQINCTTAGVFTFNYQLSAQAPLSLKLPNETLIYFIYIPGIPNAVGFIMNNKTHYFEYNGQFTVQQIIIITQPGTIVRPPAVLPDPNPFFPSEPSSSVNLPVNLNNLQPTINPSTVISNNNKPLSIPHGTVFGPSLFNVDSLLNQNSIIANGLNKPPSMSNPFQNTINSLNNNNLKPPASIPNIPSIPNNFPSLPSFPSFPNFPSTPARPSSSSSSSYCDKLNSIFGHKKETRSSTVKKRNTRALPVVAGIIAGAVIDKACEAAGTFFKEYFVKKQSFVSSMQSIAQNFETASTAVNIACNGFSWDKVTNYGLDKLGGYTVDKVMKKVSKRVPDCVKKAVASALPSLSDIFNWLLPKDPNDIVGPYGFGSSNYVSNDQKFTFVVNFENMANDTAPAQLVEVRSPLDENFNYASLKFTRYGFNDFERTLDALSRPYLTETLELELFNLRIFASANPLKREIIWQFKTIDKVTGDTPTDASLGFLPPSNGTVFGKGFIEFEILLHPQLAHLSTVIANASIVFDQNEAIPTNTLTYTVDAIAPELAITYLEDGAYLLLNASDMGSGVNIITIYDGVDNAIFVTNESISSFELPPKTKPYAIYYSIDDNVLNTYPIRFFQTTEVSASSANQSCLNNCSNQGTCMNSFCQCFSGFKGDDCNVTITTEDLLNEPARIEIGYFPTNTSGVYQLVINTNEQNPTTLRLALEAIPANVLIKYDDETVTSESIITLSDQTPTILTIQYLSPSKIDDFTLQAQITTERFNQLTNATVNVSTTFYYPISINAFNIDYDLTLKSSCYNENFQNNSIEIYSEQLSDNDILSLTPIMKPSYIELNLAKLSTKTYRLELNAIENFTEVDLYLAFQIGNQTQTFSTVQNNVQLKVCKRNEENSNNNNNNNSNNSNPNKTTIIIVVVVVGSFLIAIAVIASIAVINRKKKMNAKKSLRKRVFRATRNTYV